MTARAALALVVLSACSVFDRELPPTGQLVLYIDTDAPVPPAPGTTASSDAPPYLFDRLRIQVFRGSVEEPTALRLADRDFALHAGRFASGPVSVGILPTPGASDYVARIRLFRGDRVRLGEPPVGSTVDVRVRLPVVGEEGKTNISVVLASDDVGKPRGVGTPVEPASGKGGPTAVGTWPGARIVPCASAPLDGEACVPGGAYWMGDPRQAGVVDDGDADRERLVVIAPFFLDLTEVTVARFRQAWPTLAQKGLRAPPAWSGVLDGRSLDDWAVWSETAHPNDPGDARAALPVNGVIWDTAREFCRLRGADLPSEAMLEYVASGRGRERQYVWGDDPPSCGDAVWARAGVGLYTSYDGSCRAAGTIGGVMPPGSSVRDRVQFASSGGPPREIVDLAGNLLEWTMDDWMTQDQGLWTQPGVLRDPVALVSDAGPGALKTARGGSWRASIGPLAAAARSGHDSGFTNRSIGFRCARR